MNTSPADHSAEDDAFETTAAEWLVEREEGFSPGRAALFATWRAADPRHEAAVVRTERALSLLAEMPAVREPLHTRLAVPSNAIRPPAFRLPVWVAGLAAALVIAAGIWWMLPMRAAPTQHYATAATRQQQIALNDGSVLNLNVSTQVQVALTPEVRRVTLTAGEAHFAVAHDTARPFIVSAGGVSVRAVGTAFSVRLGDQGIEVLVTEGRVEIARDATSANSSDAPALTTERPLLVAGERTLITRDVPGIGARVERVPADVLQAANRWHSQVMTFTDLPLRDAITLFNRRNPQQLVLGDAEVGERKIGGTFAADQVELFVRLLVQDGDIVAERGEDQRILLRHAR
ncbi:MAG: FecR domain-containing protein [Opitutaceae bacterium]|nr:FecR domain-containing protein [Opitutaceae bacterium]